MSKDDALPADRYPDYSKNVYPLQKQAKKENVARERYETAAAVRLKKQSSPRQTC